MKNKSIYQNKRFAEFWNDRVGDKGDGYKRLVLDPAIKKVLGSVKNKLVLEAGFGNGYKLESFIKAGAKGVVGFDISAHNLEYAQARSQNFSAKLFLQDIAHKWKVASRSVDVVYSSMVLNEIENIKKPISEAFRVLKPKGSFVLCVTHPGWDIYIMGKQSMGNKDSKIKGLTNYFTRGHATYVMGTDTKQDPSDKNFMRDEYDVEHYHRTLEEYFNVLLKTGFQISAVVEPMPNKALLTKYPRFKNTLNFPISLIIRATKQ